MKIVSYSEKNQVQIRLGLVAENMVIDVEMALKQFAKSLERNESDNFPHSIYSYLNDWEKNQKLLLKLSIVINQQKQSELKNKNFASEINDVYLYSPIPLPNSFRDFYAFEQHVRNARKLRNLEVAKEWYDFPVFYFSNHNAFKGSDEKITKPKYTNEMDFELEIACVIGKTGKNIKIEEASDYIAGYSILNDWSARDIQREEMKVGLGPAKGKDFATSMGPYLVTPEEISANKKNKGYDLNMKARKNGHIISEGNWADIHYSFEEMIVRASQEVTLFPGDVLGSGTVGTGCILEVRPENTDGWLQSGDEIELEVEKLGILKNRIL